MVMNGKILLLIFSAIYVIVILISLLSILFILPAFREVGHLDKGCYLTDAMLPYVECVGFTGHRVAYFVLNLPYYLIFIPMLGIIAFPRAPWLVVGGVLLWVPVIYLVRRMAGYLIIRLITAIKR